MERLLFVVAIVLMAGPAYAGDCEVIDFSAYSHVSGGGDWRGVSVETEYCASYTIRNDASGGRFGPKITAHFANGRTDTTEVSTSRINSGEIHRGAVCFYSEAPVRFNVLYLVDGHL